MVNEGVIFLLENSTEYLFLLEQAFRRAEIKNSLRVARYGNEAILYLKGVGIYGDRFHYPLPSIILLDMAIPDGSGPTVLGWIQHQPYSQSIPVILLAHHTQNRVLRDECAPSQNIHFIIREDFDGLITLIKTIDMLDEPQFTVETRG